MATKTSLLSGDRLRILAREVLDKDEYSKLKQAIKNFTLTRSLETLCFQLLELFDTPKKIGLIVEIRKILPTNQREEFMTCYYKILKGKHDVKKDIQKNDRKGRKRSGWPLETNENVCEQLASNVRLSPSKKTKADYEIRKRFTKRSSSNLRAQMRTKSSRTDEINPKFEQESGVTEQQMASCEGGTTLNRQDLQRRKHGLGDKNANGVVSPIGNNLRGEAVGHQPHQRLVSIERPSLSIEFGFRLLRGTRQGSSITVGEVSEGSLAQLHGLCAGDQIVQINETRCKQATQADIVKMIKRSTKLHMRVASMVTPSDHQGSVKDRKKVGRESLPNCVKKVIIRPHSDGWLGCSIRGGTDYLCDIHVISVDDGSPAECAGLKKGDVILEVNSCSVREMTHVQAVRQIVTASQPVIFTIKSKASKDHLQYTYNREELPNLASDAEISFHQQPVYRGALGVPETPLRVDNRCPSSAHRTSPPQSLEHQLPSYPLMNELPVCSPSSIDFDALKLSPTPPPPYTEGLPSQHRRLAKGDSESFLEGTPAVYNHLDEFCSSSQRNDLGNTSIISDKPCNTRITSGNNPGNTCNTSENNRDKTSTVKPVEIKEENVCSTHKENPNEMTRIHENNFDTTTEVNSVIKSEEEEAGKNSLLSQIRGFRKETLRQVSQCSKTFHDDLQTESLVNDILSPELGCDSTNDRRTSNSSRKSDANDLLNALTHAIETRAQAMNRSIDSDKSDANEEDWD